MSRSDGAEKQDGLLILGGSEMGASPITLINGDCGLQKWDADDGWDREHRPALYLAGFFEVALAGMAGDFDTKVLKAEFAGTSTFATARSSRSRTTTWCW